MVTPPAVLTAMREALHARLRDAIDAAGATGSAARQLARLLRPHCEVEAACALAPLGLLPALGRARSPADAAALAQVLQQTDRLQHALPALLAEHDEIRRALRSLGEAAQREHQPAIAALAGALQQHLQLEEDVLYPAALLVGQVLRQPAVADSPP